MQRLCASRRIHNADLSFRKAVPGHSPTARCECPLTHSHPLTGDHGGSFILFFEKKLLCAKVSVCAVRSTLSQQEGFPCGTGFAVPFGAHMTPVSLHARLCPRRTGSSDAGFLPFTPFTLLGWTHEAPCGTRVVRACAGMSGQSRPCPSCPGPRTARP